MLVDSHCHLNCLEDFKEHGIDSYLERARKEGVAHFLCAGIDLDHREEMNELAEKYPSVWSSIGLHPNEGVSKEPTIDNLIAWAQHKKIIAIGETGLDYLRSTGDLEWQRMRFRNHIRAAKETRLPIIVHSRDAKADTIQILKEEQAYHVGGVLHCFTGDVSMAEEAIALGFYISFSGIITFKNAKDLQEVAKKIPLDHILIETDAPYLAPTPHRGKHNEPAYVSFVAKALADLRAESFETIASATTSNFFKLFSKAVVSS